MAPVGRRLGQGLFALGVLVLALPSAAAAGQAGHVTVVRSASGAWPVMALGQPSAAGRATAPPERTPASGRRSPPTGRLPEPANNRVYGLPVALAIVAVGGVLSLLLRVLFAEGARHRTAGCGPHRSAD